MNKAMARRWARYDFRHDQAEAIARDYRSVIDNYYEVNLQARPDAAEHGAEISAQPRPIFRYPPWMFEDLTIPEDGLSGTKLPTPTRKPGFRVVTVPVDRHDTPAPDGDRAAAPPGRVTRLRTNTRRLSTRPQEDTRKLEWNSSSGSTSHPHQAVSRIDRRASRTVSGT